MQGMVDFWPRLYKFPSLEYIYIDILSVSSIFFAKLTISCYDADPSSYWLLYIRYLHSNNRVGCSDRYKNGAIDIPLENIERLVENLLVLSVFLLFRMSD